VENFFDDNDDMRFQFEHVDLGPVIELLEEGFREAEEHADAPRSVEHAREGYRRILSMIGEICAQEIAPLAESVDEEGARLDGGRVTYAAGTRKALEMLAGCGLMGFTLPRRYGGLNMPITVYTVANELVSQADASLMNLFGLQDIAETICEFADESIRREYLPRFAKGGETGAMDLTEPDAGSDLQSVMLRAEEEGGRWYLTGVKRFITNGCADISLVLARSEAGTTDGRGLSLFLCEKCPQLVVRRIEHKMGIHGSPTCELQFNRVPAILVGRRRMGLIRYVMSLMNGARLAIAAQALGIAQAAYEVARRYARERIQFRRPIEEFPAVYEMLVSMKTAIQAARAIAYETARVVDLRKGTERAIERGEGGPDAKARSKALDALAGVLTPLAKYYATEMGNRVANDAIQILGGPGYMREFHVERHFRDIRITNIYEGTSQLQVIGAIGGIVTGVLARHLSTLDPGDWPADLLSLAGAAREMRALLDRCVALLNERKDVEYHDYVARRVVDIACETLASWLFLGQARAAEARKILAKRHIRDALPRVRMNAEVVLSGDRTTIENWRALI